MQKTRIVVFLGLLTACTYELEPPPPRYPTRAVTQPAPVASPLAVAARPALVARPMEASAPRINARRTRRAAAPEVAVAPDPTPVPEAREEAIALVPNAPAVELRFLAPVGIHVGLELRFSPSHARVKMDVLREVDGAPVSLATARRGLGIRTLSVLETEASRHYRVRIRTTGDVAGEGVLRFVHTEFDDGLRCERDCSRLLQLPLPVAPAVDGYAVAENTEHRYQFGRRDLVMLVRHLARAMAARGHEPFVVEDLSQWDGHTPGTDVGEPRHASHEGGLDVDLPLYGRRGNPVWRARCLPRPQRGGRACVPGTVFDFNGEHNARFFALMFESGRVDRVLLDQALIDRVDPRARRLMRRGEIPRALWSHFRHKLRHWPSHRNHLHLRLRDTGPDAEG